MRITKTVVSSALVLGSVACSGGSTEPPPCTNPTETTSVVMDDFSYGPSCVAVRVGTTISLDNRGAAPHTFTVEGTDVDADVPAGDRGTVEIRGIPVGSHTVTCTYHPQMVATLEVS